MSPTDQEAPDNAGTSTDGGNQLPFNVGQQPQSAQDVTETRWEQIRRFYDLFIYAPFKILWADWRARIGLSIFGMYIFMGTIGIMIVPTTGVDQAPDLLQPFEDMSHILGTDRLGQDMLSLIVHSTPPMLKMMFSGAGFAVILGSVVGTLSGYKGGATERILMTITDIFLNIPGLPLIIVLSVMINPRNPYFVGIILAINTWAGLARALRSQVLTLREIEYVEVSFIMGVSTPYILAKDILPQLLPYILINFVTYARNVLFASVGLYFLGILPVSAINWGVILNQAYTRGALYAWSMFHWIYVPLITIVLLVLSLVLLSQALDRVVNPRIRARHEKTTATTDDDLEQ